jgi:hypothetical protein
MFEELHFGTYYEVIAFELGRSLSRYYDIWLEILCKDEKKRELYLSKVEQARISTVVLICTAEFSSGLYFSVQNFILWFKTLFFYHNNCRLKIKL